MLDSQFRLVADWSLTVPIINTCQLSPAENSHEDTEGRPHPDIPCVVPVVRDPADGGGGRHHHQHQLQPELEQHRLGWFEAELEVNLES